MGGKREQGEDQKDGKLREREAECGVARGRLGGWEGGRTGEREEEEEWVEVVGKMEEVQKREKRGGRRRVDHVDEGKRQKESKRREMGGEKKMEEGEEQEQRKQQGKTHQEEHKTRTTLNILVMSGPNVKKVTCEHHGVTWPTFLVQSVSVSSPKEVLLCRTWSS